MTEVDREELSLRDYWRVILRRKWLIVIALICTVTPAVALSLAQKPVYVARAVMLLQSKPGESVFATSSATANPDRLVQNQIAVLQGDVVYARVISDLGLKHHPPSVRGSSSGSTDVVSVSVRSNDPRTAAILANAYVQAYGNVKRSQAVDGLTLAGVELQSKVTAAQEQIDKIDKQVLTATSDEKIALAAQRNQLASQQALFKNRLDQIQVDAALSTGSAQLIAPASPPREPVEPTPERNAALAIVVGLLLGLGAAFLIDYLDDCLRSPEDLLKLGSVVPLLAVVPVDPPPDNRPVALSRPQDAAVEAYRSLRTSVQFLGFDRAVRVIEVTSAVPGEGKTTTASNLAVVLAQTGATVVLVDADLRRPRLGQVFGVPSFVGLTNNLVGESLDLTINQVDDNLAVITSGAVPPNPSEMLSGRRMSAVIDELKTRFDYVIIDTAPVIPVSDAVAMSRLVDGVLIVAQAGRTSAPQLREVLAKLEQVSAPVLGVVFNRAKRRRHTDYAMSYGYGYAGGYAPIDERTKLKT